MQNNIFYEKYLQKKFTKKPKWYKEHQVKKVRELIDPSGGGWNR